MVWLDAGRFQPVLLEIFWGGQVQLWTTAVMMMIMSKDGLFFGFFVKSMEIWVRLLKNN